jgi:hypothetical protein
MGSIFSAMADVLSVVVDDLDAVGLPVVPLETDPPLAIV